MNASGSRRDPGTRPRIRRERGLHAGDEVHARIEQGLEDFLRAGKAHERRMLQSAGEEEVVGAAGDDADAVPVAVDLRRVLQRRRCRHEVDAFDRQVRRGKCDARRAHRLDREEADVPRVLVEPGEHVPGLLIGHERHPRVERAGERAREVRGDAAGSAVRLAAGEHGIAEVDRGSQHAGGREFVPGRVVHPYDSKGIQSYVASRRTPTAPPWRRFLEFAP
jgi:hypothetical protein